MVISQSYQIISILLYQATINGHSETGMFTEYQRMGCTNGEENRGIINKAKWRIRFIDTKPSLEGNYGQEQKKVEELKQKLVG